MDRRTDGQTDGRTEFSSQYRVCITCSAVKTSLLLPNGTSLSIFYCRLAIHSGKHGEFCAKPATTKHCKAKSLLCVHGPTCTVIID